jgi:hypothetical protein
MEAFSDATAISWILRTRRVYAFDRPTNVERYVIASRGADSLPRAAVSSAI